MYFPDEWFDIVACDRCGLGFVNPRPPVTDISRFYQNEYYDGFIEEDHSERYHEEASYLPNVADFDKTPLLLDIGCSVGDFPRFAATLNWHVEGVEPYCPVPIEDFTVYRQPFEKLTGIEDKFDAITAWAVLEHVHDPMAYFLKAGQALKKDGVFVFQVTNFNSLSSKRLFHEDVPRHIYFFTQKTVEEYLEAGGMELESSDFDDNIFSMGCRGALNYFYTRFIWRALYTWEDRPVAYPDFLNQRNLNRSPLSAVQFILKHPVTSLDRLFEPAFDRWQKLTGTYGMVTYKARKKH